MAPLVVKALASVWAAALAAALTLAGAAGLELFAEADRVIEQTTTTTAPAPAPATTTAVRPLLDGNRWKPQTANDAEFVARTNDSRAGLGLPALAWSDDLYAYAVDHLVEMLAHPERGVPGKAGLWHSDIAQALGGEAGWTDVGENLGTGADVADVHAWLLASPTHHANIVDPEFSHMGVATVDDGHRLVTVHVYGGVRP